MTEGSLTCQARCEAGLADTTDAGLLAVSVSAAYGIALAAAGPESTTTSTIGLVLDDGPHLVPDASARYEPVVMARMARPMVNSAANP